PEPGASLKHLGRPDGPCTGASRIQPPLGPGCGGPQTPSPTPRELNTRPVLCQAGTGSPFWCRATDLGTLDYETGLAFLWSFGPGWRVTRGGGRCRGAVGFPFIHPPTHPPNCFFSLPLPVQGVRPRRKPFLVRRFRRG